MGTILSSAQQVITRGAVVLASALAAAAVSAIVASRHGADSVLAVLAVLAVTALLGLAMASRCQSNRLRDSQDALCEQNQRLDGAISSISQALSMFDENERLVLWNARYAEMYGFPPEFLQQGTTLSELLRHRAGHGASADHPEPFRRALVRSSAEGRGLRNLIETADGRTICVISHPLAGGGWIATHEDITELRRAEQEAQRAHAHLREAIEAMPVGVIIFDADRRLVMQNRRMDLFYPETVDLRQQGTRFEDLLRRSLDRGVIVDAIGREEEWLAERLARIEQPQRVREQRLSNGRWMRIADCRTADGGFIGIRVDITELKRREAELAMQNTRFSAAVANISQGLVMYDADQRLVLFNRRYAELYELPSELLRPGQTTIGDVLAYRQQNGTFPGDAEAFRRHRVAAIANGEAERRTIEIKGRRTVAVISQPMPDGNWVATHEDITDRRRAEQELARAEQFLDQVIENVPSAIIVKDVATGHYLHVNRAAEVFLGLSREAIIGKAPSDIYPPEHAQWIAARDAEVLRSGGALLSDEVPVQTVRNGVRMVNTRRMTIAGPDGQPEYLLVVNEDVTERKHAEARIAHMAHHDALTGLPNRVRFQERLTQALNDVVRGASLAVICLDLDHFKSVNDTLGHSFGDELLKQVAARLRTCVQDDEAVARLGGDEFAIIQTPIRHPTETALLVQRISAAIKQPFEIGGHQIDIDVSMGISLAPSDAGKPDTLLKNADLALYGAKGAGRGTYRFFKPEMDARMSTDWPASSTCTTSRSSRSPTSRCSATRRCCAGTTRSAARFRRRSSFRSRRKLA
jgi:diguanylate cyclase (GGDEF)-like protein/PAS domain S-box-containing protein